MKMSFNTKNFFQRFPDLCCDIFDQLDDQNLAKSKKLSVTLCSFINSEKKWWIRVIQKYADEDINEDPDIWRKVIVRTQIEIVKNLATASRQFYKHYQKGYHWSPLHITAHYGDLKLFMQILKKVDQKNPTNSSGDTPLYIAAQNGNFDVCRFIIGNLDIKNPAKSCGCTPLYIAAQNGHFDVCKFIIDNVDEKNPATNGGFTPLYVAASNGHIDICKFIIDNVDNKNPANNDGHTPLYIAA